MSVQQVVLDENGEKKLVPVSVDGNILWAIPLPGPFPTDSTAVAQLSATVPVGGLVSSEEPE